MAARLRDSHWSKTAEVVVSEGLATYTAPPHSLHHPIFTLSQTHTWFLLRSQCSLWPKSK